LGQDFSLPNGNKFSSQKQQLAILANIFARATPEAVVLLIA
jgi:hypothetical protein